MRFLLILLACVALVGCGDAVTDGQKIDNDANAITAAAEKTTEQDTVRIKLSGTAEVNGQAAETSGEGIVDLKRGASAVTTQATVGENQSESEAILLDGFMYLRQGGQWGKINFDKVVGGGLADAINSASPTQYLDLLEGSGDVRTAGTEPIDGRRTTHYTATLDYEQLAESGPEAIRGVAKKSLEFSASPTVPVEVWIDDSGLIRRQRLVFETKAVGSAPAQKQDVTIDYVEYGVDASGISAPPDAIDLTDQVLEGLD